MKCQQRLYFTIHHILDTSPPLVGLLAKTLLIINEVIVSFAANYGF